MLKIEFPNSARAGFRVSWEPNARWVKDGTQYISHKFEAQASRRLGSHNPLFDAIWRWTYEAMLLVAKPDKIQSLATNGMEEEDGQCWVCEGGSEAVTLASGCLSPGKCDRLRTFFSTEDSFVEKENLFLQGEHCLSEIKNTTVSASSVVQCPQLINGWNQPRAVVRENQWASTHLDRMCDVSYLSPVDMQSKPVGCLRFE